MKELHYHKGAISEGNVVPKGEAGSLNYITGHVPLADKVGIPSILRHVVAKQTHIVTCYNTQIKCNCNMMIN